MSQVEEAMIQSIRVCFRNSFLQYDNEARNAWIQKNPCQIVLTIDSCMWVRLTEQFFLVSEGEDPEDVGNMDDFCMKIILDLEDEITLLRTDLTTV